LLAQGIEQFTDEIRQGKSERLQEYLTFTSRFHRYSLHNQFLIFMQRLEATHVAGYKAWEKLGHQVKRGEKAIRIYVPQRHQLTTQQGDGIIDGFRKYAQLMTPTVTLSAVEADPSDNKFVECAVAGRADYMVSGDRHLLARQQGRLLITYNPKDFKALAGLNAETGVIGVSSNLPLAQVSSLYRMHH